MLTSFCRGKTTEEFLHNAVKSCTATNGKVVFVTPRESGLFLGDTELNPSEIFLMSSS
jgi:hypothetical protein